jgi:hypothetical protein
MIIANYTYKRLYRVVLDLHFDACYFQKDKDPGQYRRSGIEVTLPERQGPGPVSP